MLDTCGKSSSTLQSSSKVGCSWTDCNFLVMVHGRRREMAEQGVRWEARERQAQVVSVRQGHNIRRCGFGLIE